MTFSEAFARGRSIRRDDDAALASRKAAREDLDIRKKAQDFKMMQAGYDPETREIIPNSSADVSAAQNRQAIQLANAFQGKLAAQDTDNALLDYQATGDATYLQNALSSNPTIKKAWAARGVQNVSNIDWQNDTKLLSKSGLKPTSYDTPEKQEVLKKNMYKVFNGKDWSIGLLSNVVRDTGSMRRLGQRRGQPLMDGAQDFRDLLAGPKVSANTAEGHKYEKEIMAASEKTGVPPNLLASMIAQESSGNKDAVSPKGASGLMQLMPGTAKELGVEDINDPGQNIMAGATYLAKQLKRHNGNTSLALASYNAGPGKVSEYGGVPPFKETQDYIANILKNYEKGERHYNNVDENGVIDARGSRHEDRINTIRAFYRDNANAEKGTTSAIVDQAAKDESALTQAKVTAAANPVAKSTEKIRNLNAAESRTNELVKEFGGEEKFFGTDFKDRKNFNKAWKNVVKINKLEGTELTNADKKNITDIRGLIDLAGPASKLTAAQTGLLDSQLSGISKYITDNAPGVNKKAAMASFRNTLRNSLYGSTLTDGEIAAFNEAFGSNKQQLGPILSQFKVALGQVQEKLSSISRLGNPYTMHVMVGTDEKKLERVRTALQERIDHFEGKFTPESKRKAARKPIENIFGKK